MANFVLGIDLGTTNTCVAFVEAGRPRVLASAEGGNTFPSVMAVGAEGQWLVGSTALRQRSAKPRQTVYAAKRLIGRPADQTSKLQSGFAYELIAHRGAVGVRLGGQPYAIAEVSAVLLQSVKERAEQVFGEPVRDAVIAVPAYFNERQRQATRDAGLIAGFRVLKVLSEPTAAAVAYGLGRGEGKRVMVFDLGGGTFDVTVIETEGKKFRVAATGGDTNLGGQDFDRLLVDYLAAEFEKKHGVDPRQAPEALARMQEAVEKVKCELSATVQSLVNLPFLAVVNGQPQHLERQINRALLEQLSAGLVARCIAVAKKTLEEAKIAPAQIDEVLLVGGMTRMPKVAQAVEQLTGRAPSKAINPDEAVALGAAVVGEWIAEEAGGDLTDVLPLAMGLTLSGNKMGVLVEKNTPLPAAATKTYTTSKEQQTRIKVHVRQGESENAKENVLLGAFNLLLAEAQPKGKPKIDVTFEIDANGILHVTAEEKGAGRRGKVLIRPQADYGTGVSEEVSFQQAEAHREAFEKAQRELEQVERLFAQLGRGLSGLEKSKIEGKLRSLRSAILDENLDEVETLLPEVTALGQAQMERLRGGKAAG